jgi:2-polyprenyl-3-methyl-5-hydroxy-6-metoxy-1,4-benzoquinol methylase
MTTERKYEYNRIADIKRLKFIEEKLQKTISSKGRVLDVGCGNGVISRYLGSLGYEVLGIDVDPKTIAKAAQLNSLPNVSFTVKSAEQLVAEGKQYDAVICSEVLEHLNNPSALLGTLYKSVKDDGVLVVTVPNGKGPREVFVTKPVIKMRRQNNWIWKFIQGIKRTLGYSGTTTQSDADNLDHVQFFSKTDLEKLAVSNHFRITDFGKSNFVEDVFPFSFLAKRIKWLQKVDCAIADKLPYGCTGGFLTIWKKADTIN